MSAGTIVRKLPRDVGMALRAELESRGFEFRSVAHAAFGAKGPGVNVVYYLSGKLVVQGKGAHDFAATYLGGDEAAEGRAAADSVTEPIIGTDESGKGDYFGPLVVAAVLVRPEDVPVLDEIGVRDSKAVADAQARRLAETIVSAYGDRVSVVEIPPVRYNELHRDFGSNLNRLLAWAHARAMENVLERHACRRALSDRFGNEKLIRNALMERGRELDLAQRVRAESHPAVAAASIVARARFLIALERLSREAGTKLPKGAGWPVDAAARELFRDGGLERLRPFAKLHFKTTEKVKQPR